MTSDWHASKAWHLLHQGEDLGEVCTISEQAIVHALLSISEAIRELAPNPADLPCA